MLPPFNAIADVYDAGFSATAVGRMQRAVVHRWLETCVQAGMHVLELNCGTGEDACWLAGRGCQVWATDVAPAMVAHTAAKAGALGLDARVHTFVLDMRTLGPGAAWPAGCPGQFDLILSNFGGLNCLAPAEMHRLGPILSGFLRPAGRLAVVVMGRFCAWETLYFLLKGKWRTAFRRLSSGPVQARLDALTTVPTWYYHPAQLRAFFPELTPASLQPVGCWLPPSYLDPWFVRRPRSLAWLDRLEQLCRRAPWAWAADHFMAVFQRKVGY